MIINEMPGISLGSTTATVDKVFNGYTAYDGQGNLITGNALSMASTATASEILTGYTAYNNLGELMSGSAVSGTDHLSFNFSIPQMYQRSGWSTVTIHYYLEGEWASYNVSVSAMNYGYGTYTGDFTVVAGQVYSVVYVRNDSRYYYVQIQTNTTGDLSWVFWLDQTTTWSGSGTITGVK